MDIRLTICLLAGLILSPAAYAAAVPYDLQKFQPVLDASKLQAPGTGQLIGTGQFAGKSNPYFYLDPTGAHMAFHASGDGSRSELRQEVGDDWDTATTDRLSLDASVRLVAPDSETLNEYTFMQIHSTDALGVPLLRLTWQRDRSGLQDRLWARVRTPQDFSKPISPENLGGLTLDLGQRPAGFFDASIVVKESRMLVLIDGQVKLDMDVSYWDGKNNYFKAGVYLQDPGSVEVQFDALAYGVNVPQPASAAILALAGAAAVSRRPRSQSR